MSPSRKCSARTGALMLVATLVVALPAASRASLIVTVNPSAAAPGGTGAFDVVTSSTGGTFGASGFSIELAVSAGSGVKFTAVDAATTAAPYLFGTLQSTPFTFNALPATDFIVSDADMNSPFFVNVTPTNSYGLEHVTYSVAPGTASGPVTVSIVGLSTAAATSEIDDISGTPIPFTAVNGIITVAAVPEPTALMIGGIGSLICGLCTRRRKPSTPCGRAI